ncbi:Hypothetical predicted protein [Octopus vulgaris]|uniref:Uncharacterized protein n=1 Tax=Octopus vulgaris TaxID=6645 RepID=A0AA36F430_OCTVU|nr:Hypothetical predicted protein [Octopus vulgaris]
MNTTENYIFSKCYENLYSETEKMADHSQYPDVLNEGLHKTTELNEGEDFTEGKTGHIDSRDDDRENNTENHIGNVMEMIQIDVKEGQDNDKLNDDDETAKHDYSKDEKTKRSACEVADDKNVYVNNRLECKTLNGEKDVCPDKHPVKLSKRSAELDNSLPKEDGENFATNKKCIIKGGKISSISRINPHRINTATERIQNSKTNLTSSFYIPKRSRQEQPENNDGISSTRRPFEKWQNFTAHEQHLNIPKPYPRRMSSCEYRLSMVDMLYNKSERKTNYPRRRISESKVSAPLRRRSVSYLQNNNSASPKSKQGLSRSQQYRQLRDSLDIVIYEIDRLRKALKNRRSHIASQPHTSRPRRYSHLRDSLELAKLRWASKNRGSPFTALPHTSRYVPEYHQNVRPPHVHKTALRVGRRPSRYVSDYHIHVEHNSKHNRSRSQPYSQLGDLKLTRSQWALIVRRLRSTEQPHSSRYVPDYHINVEPSNSKHDRSRSQQYSQLEDLKLTRSQWEAIVRRLRSTEQPDYDINVEPFQPSSRPPESLKDTRSHQLHSPRYISDFQTIEPSYPHRDSLERNASNVGKPVSSSHNRAGRRIFTKVATKLRDKVRSIFGKKRIWAPDASFHPGSYLPKNASSAVLQTSKRIN